MLTRLLGLLALGAATVFAAAPDTARAEPLRIVIDDPTIEPLPFAVPSFQPAPKWMRMLALEWLWRAMQSPQRLVPRYARCFAILPRLTLAAWRAR